MKSHSWANHYTLSRLLILLASVIGLSQALNLFWLYFFIAGNFGAGPQSVIAVTVTLALSWAAGSIWWGRSIDGESSLAPRLLAVLLTLGFLAILPVLFLIPVSLKLETFIFPWQSGSPQLIGLARIIAMAPLTFLAGFFAGGSLPLLGEICFPHRRNLGVGLPLLHGFWLLGIALGLILGFYVLRFHWGFFLLAAFLVSAISISATVLIGSRGRKKTEQPSRLRLWPSPSLGLWGGDKNYGLDHIVPLAQAKIVWLITILYTAAGFGSLRLWVVSFMSANSLGQDSHGIWLVTITVAMALGSLISISLKKVLSSTWFLALLCLVECLVLFIGPEILKEISGPIQGFDLLSKIHFWYVVLLLIPLGALWPLVGRILQAKRLWLGSSLGLASLYIFLGAAIGWAWPVIGPGNFHQSMAIFVICAFLAAALALVPLINWLLSIILLFGSIWLFFVLSQPIWFSVNFPSQTLGFQIMAPNMSLQRPQGMAVIIAEMLTKDLPLKTKVSDTLIINDNYHFISDNFNALGRPVLRVGLGLNEDMSDDPKHYLAIGRKDFSLIFSGTKLKRYDDNAFNFYQSCQKRLKEDGLFAKILPLKHYSPPELMAELKDFCAVFKGVSLWYLGEDQALVLGWKKPTEYLPLASDKIQVGPLGLFAEGLNLDPTALKAALQLEPDDWPYYFK